MRNIPAKKVPDLKGPKGTIDQLNEAIVTSPLIKPSLDTLEKSIGVSLETLKSNLRKKSHVLNDEEKIILNKAIGDLWATSALITALHPHSKAAAEEEHRNAAKFYLDAYKLISPKSELGESIFKLIKNHASYLAGYERFEMESYFMLRL